MKVSLTKIKYAAFASRETNCFEAVVLLDGVPSIHVSNDGHGGCNYERDIVPGSVQRLHDYAKSLPKRSVTLSGDTFVLDESSELIVGDLLEDYLKRKEMKRTLSRKAAVKIGDKLYTYSYKWMAHGANEAFKKMVLAKHPGAIFLNELSEDEAMKLWSSE